MSIKILPYPLIRKIAAGEIIDRPASVIKELIENSIDSGATCINIYLEKAGTQLIYVNDNGSGIEKNDLKIILSRYSTSKISSINDLENNIITMGFRGEALASISAVSRILLISKTSTQYIGWKIYVEGNTITNSIKLTPSAHPTGTTIEIMDLFYNIPVRRKFMKEEKTELIYINEMLQKFAFIYPKITFILKNNDKLIKSYVASKTLNNYYSYRIQNIFGNEFIKNTINFYLTYNLCSIWGILYNPNIISISNSKNIHYHYVNKRIIYNKLINLAIKQAYSEIFKKFNLTTQKKKHPIFYIVSININPSQIDINIHPKKNEIKFYKPRLIHHYIYTSTLNALIKYFNKNNKYSSIENIYKNISSKNSNILENNNIIINKTNNMLIPISKSYNHNNYNDKTINFSQKYIKKNNILNNKFLTKILTIIPPHYALIEHYYNIYFLSLKKCKQYIIEQELFSYNKYITTTPLIIPIRLELTNIHISTLIKYNFTLHKIGFTFKIYLNQGIFSIVPKVLINDNLQTLLYNLLNYLSITTKQLTYYNIINWLSKDYLTQSFTWTYSSALKLIIYLETKHPYWIKTSNYTKLLEQINLKYLMKKIND